ncbi:excalibur calcium-binding domain-containing protein [Paenibacillus oryzae]|uniref:excalibur calcium-binding domain-containing protein n=1 Tax=Paenibacillus oryzae TaxID=1844972 RepID=UPI001FDF6C25|nr:excalibur calcium-binding domain-containing protein [Paenibacillus oryzae]
MEKPENLFPDAPAGDEEVVYANCAAVREAGKAPLYKGDPGYSSKLDRDGDGVACQ